MTTSTEIREEITHLLMDRQATTEEALAIFDQLEPVSLTFLLGRGKGKALKLIQTIPLVAI